MNPPEILDADQPEVQSRVLINELSVEMATVNGTGSQSANNILAKAMFRMGIPVGAKNLFPSNIQGLPTWFTLRASGRGYTGRRKELDWLVGMNAATWEQDVAKLGANAVVLYNSSDLSTEPLEKRDDLVVYPVPITELVQKNIKAPKLRRMLANVVYVGALAELLGMDKEILAQVVQDSFASKPKAIEVNIQALHLGMDYVRENLKKKDPYRLEKSNQTEGKVLIDGNTMCALGSLMAGCTVVGWYPITPSSSLCESLIAQFRRFRVDPNTGEHRFADVQMEDELASIGMVLGAGWAGARSMTSTSGPGISLMAEFIGFGYYAEIPVVIFDVQRIGPSTGLPTRTSQGDVTLVAYCSHGDTEHLVLYPDSPEECYSMGYQAFDLAERFQTPVFVLTDLDLGMNHWMSKRPEYPTEGFDRGKVLSAEEIKTAGEFSRYLDKDGDGIPYRTLPGNSHPLASYFTRGSGHDEHANYTESGETYVRNMNRLLKKLETARAEMPTPIVDQVDGASVGIIAFGTTNTPMREARDQLLEAGLKTSYLRIRATPLNTTIVQKFLEDHERIYMIEQNRDGQMESLIRANIKEGRLTDRLRHVRHFDGMPVDARSITDGILTQEPR